MVGVVGLRARVTRPACRRGDVGGDDFQGLLLTCCVSWDQPLPSVALIYSSLKWDEQPQR